MSEVNDPIAARARDALARGDTAAAAEALAKVIASDRRADWAYNDLITLLATHGRRGEAEQLARVALRVNPENAGAHDRFGTLLSEQNDLPAGEWHFRRALKLGGPKAGTLANLALNLMKQGLTAESGRRFAEADALAPRTPGILAHWSKLQEVLGDLEGAERLLDQAQAASSPGAINLLRAQYLSRAGRNAEALAIIEAESVLNGDALLERGRLRELALRYDEAWRDFVEGKARLAAEAGGLTHDAAAVRSFYDALKEFFVRANVARLPRAPRRDEVPQPIFVVGFPRSGTTMIEQVLSSHTAVRAGGELPYLGELRQLAIRLLPDPAAFPECLARTWTADNRHAAMVFRDHYLARAATSGLLAPGKAWFVDKMPFNEMYLPLLLMAFPESKVIRIQRDPRDVCVSMLANHLTHGFNCAYRIGDIVQHLSATSDLLQHYLRELAFNEFVLRYEGFVADQEGETRRLLAYLGLPFEEACLRFHENPRYAPTPSYARVTDRLNDRSIGRHRHYATYLEPHRAALGPLLTAGSYRP